MHASWIMENSNAVTDSVYVGDVTKTYLFIENLCLYIDSLFVTASYVSVPDPFSPNLHIHDLKFHKYAYCCKYCLVTTYHLFMACKRNFDFVVLLKFSTRKMFS